VDSLINININTIICWFSKILFINLNNKKFFFIFLHNLFIIFFYFINLTIKFYEYNKSKRVYDLVVIINIHYLINVYI